MSRTLAVLVSVILASVSGGLHSTWGDMFTEHRSPARALDMASINKSRFEGQRQLMEPEAGSDGEGVEVFLVLDDAGRRSVLVKQYLRIGFVVTGPRFWFIDRGHLTYKVIALTGNTESDTSRLLAEYARRGRDVPADRIRDKVVNAWTKHQVWIGERAGRLEEARSTPIVPTPGLVESGAQAPDGSERLTTGVDDPYCWGEHQFDMLWEDPVAIDVSETKWEIEFDGWWEPITESSPDCWDKDAAGWPYPLDTEWYTDQCSLGGWSNTGGTDRYVQSYYHNSDWGDDEEETVTWALGGLQFGPYYPPNVWEQFGADGEDSGLLTYDDQGGGWYICTY